MVNPIMGTFAQDAHKAKIDGTRLLTSLLWGERGVDSSNFL